MLTIATFIDAATTKVFYNVVFYTPSMFFNEMESLYVHVCSVCDDFTERIIIIVSHILWYLEGCMLPLNLS